MAFGAGRNGVFKIDGTVGGSLNDISAYLTSVKLNTEQGTYDSTVLGLTTRTFVGGLGQWSIDIDGFYDPVIDGYFGTVDAASRSIDYFPAGSPVGSTKPEFTGEVLKTKYDIGDPVDGIVPFTASFQGTGTLNPAVA